ncbi:hypothetical protein KSP35_12405 [Aquihabitans sp. G128]|uniref:hypothetical protein n=1 Tax=Aquihabitans sp. G128 TaxID=2849779 RepID=UPI001C244D83|nr:hypothetical protein [Aquihabitans sp. G128]QXC59212.1 hypothetical protein KSP35_12405 [Aquihabitans sp. G128]
MHAIHARSTRSPRPTTADHGPFAWEVAHAAPEDRAVGLELELIELVARRQSMVDTYDGESEALDAEIERTLAELGNITPALPLAG